MTLTPEEWTVVLLSLKVGAVAMAATLPVAFALAWVLARGRFPGKVLLDALVPLPLVLPPVVTGWLLLIPFAPAGPLGAVLADWFGPPVFVRWPGSALDVGVMALHLVWRTTPLT